MEREHGAKPWPFLLRRYDVFRNEYAVVDFEWNLRKAAENEREHRVTFQEATEVFADDYSSTVSDPDHSIGESRLKPNAVPATPRSAP